MTARRPVNKDDNFYKRLINRCHKRLLEDLYPASILDLFLEKEYIPYTEVRDIQETRLSSDQIRAILRRVSSKGVKGYKEFKEFLRESQQEHLVEYLDEQEAELEKDIKMAERNKEAPSQSSPPVPQQTENAKRYSSDNRNTQAEQTAQNLGARPKTRPSSQNIMNQGSGEQQVTDDFEKMALGEKGYKNLQETPVEYSGNPGQEMDPDQNVDISLSRQRGDFGNTRRNDPNVSNAFGPDMSRNTYHGTDIDGRTRQDNTDETDASRERSVEGLSPQPNQKQYIEIIDRTSGVPDLNQYGYMTSGVPDLNQYSYMPSLKYSTSNQFHSPPSLEQSLLQEINENVNLLVHQNKHKTVEQRGQVPQTKRAASRVPPKQQLEQPSQAPSTLDDADGVNKGDKQRLIKEREMERDKRLKVLFSSGDDVQGRLKGLSEQNVTDLMDCCGTSRHATGGFGDIYVSKKPISGLDMKVVIKKIELEESDVQKMRSITNEKLASRTMHFGIVPLLALREDIKNRTYFFMSPYFENGDLFEAIKSDNQKGTGAVLDIERRLRILFHIASAIDFLHTPVKGFRETVLHMDIKTLNIVLDKNFNARLIDFGLAREMREGEQAIHTTTTELAHTEGYYRPMKGFKLTKHADYYNFGVVIRELLTGLPPYDEKKSEREQLKNLTALKIPIRLQVMWIIEKKKPIQIAKDLIQLSSKCIEDKDLKDISSDYILSKLTRKIKDRNEQRWVDKNKYGDKNDRLRCEMCLAYTAVEDKMLAHAVCCECNLKICVTCMRNSYLNPIRCHSCDAIIKPIIGQDWGAILIAGHGAENFKDDVTEIEKVITSKWPLVMGISESMVRTVYPENTETGDCMENRLKSAISFLNRNEDIQTILIYYSGHYQSKEVEGKGGEGFQLGEKEYLSVKKLQTMLAPFLKSSKAYTSTVLTSRRFIVCLDCCRPPSLLNMPTTKAQTSDIEPQASPQVNDQSGDAQNRNYSQTKDKSKNLPVLSFEDSGDYSIVQMNACRHNQKIHGSLFRKFLVQALTRKALQQPCLIDERNEKCSNCGLDGDFVTMQALRNYIKKHFEKCSMKFEPVIHDYNVSTHDAEIGYVINFSADLRFSYKFKNRKTSGSVAKEMFNDMLPLKTVLYDNFFGEMKRADEIKEPIPSPTDFVDILCIEVERGSKKKDKEELDTIEKITGAWNSKRELLVSLREISEIRHGKVGIFLVDDKASSFHSFLRSKDYAKDSNDSSGIFFSVAAGDLPVLHEELEIEELQDPISEVMDENAMKVHGIKVTELQVIFPVKSDRQSLLRDDFVCFQVKSEMCQ